MSRKRQPLDMAMHECVLWMLYGLDVSGEAPEDFLTQSFSLVLDHDSLAADYWENIENCVFGVYGKMDELNAEVQRLSPRWKLERMATIDRNILRLGVWEILERKIRPIITINVCVELAKAYGEKSTSGFVNGLLDQLCTDNEIAVS